MYLHLGQSTVVNRDDIIGIFDMDNSTVMKNTRNFLAEAEKNGEVINITYELPKSFILCCNKKSKKTKVYISQISPSTLLKRSELMYQYL